MNKKAYMIPAMEVVKIQTQQMLADSLTIGGETDHVDARGFEFTVDGEY